MTRHPCVRPGESGLTLVEMIGVLWLCLILLAIGAPAMLGGLDDLRTRSASRYLSGECFRLRSDAVKAGARTALRFVASADDHAMGRFRDGNGNGVQTREITLGIDRRIGDDVTIGALFPGVRFGIGAGVPLIDGGFATDPIHLGTSNILTFSPDGSATSGTLYIRGRRQAQYAVRVLGVTGRTRVFRYLGGTWKPL